MHKAMGSKLSTYAKGLVLATIPCVRSEGLGKTANV